MYSSNVDQGKAAPAAITPTCCDSAASSIEKSKEDASVSSNQESKEPNIDFKVIYNKKKYDVSLPPDTDIGAVKTHLQPIIAIPPAMMKVCKTSMKDCYPYQLVHHQKHVSFL